MKRSKIWSILNTNIPYTPKLSKKSFVVSVILSTTITVVSFYNPSYSSFIIFAEISRIGIVFAIRLFK